MGQLINGCIRKLKYKRVMKKRKEQLHIRGLAKQWESQQLNLKAAQGRQLKLNEEAAEARYQARVKQRQQDAELYERFHRPAQNYDAQVMRERIKQQLDHKYGRTDRYGRSDKRSLEIEAMRKLVR